MKPEETNTASNNQSKENQKKKKQRGHQLGKPEIPLLFLYSSIYTFCTQYTHHHGVTAPTFYLIYARIHALCSPGHITQ